MESSTLDRMIVENITDLDAATNRMWQIEAKVAKALDILKETWALRNDWICGDDSWLSGDCSLGKSEWAETGDPWLAWFELGSAHGDPEPGDVGTESFWLTRLCGEGSGRLGFRFHQSQVGSQKWKKFLRARTGSMVGTQFVIDDSPSIFLPVAINKAALAAAVEEEDYGTCLMPIHDAMDYIKDNVAKFELLLDLAINHTS